MTVYFLILLYRICLTVYINKIMSAVQYRLEILRPTWYNFQTGRIESYWPSKLTLKYADRIKAYYMQMLQNVTEEIDICINTDHITIARVDNKDSVLQFKTPAEGGICFEESEFKLILNPWPMETYVRLIDSVHMLWPPNRIHRRLEECIICNQAFIMREWDQPKQCARCISQCVICQSWITNGHVFIFNPYPLTNGLDNNQTASSLCDVCIKYSRHVCIYNEILEFIQIADLATIIKEYL